jgi:hypothetical protein
MMIPAPPASQIIGGALMLAGGLMQVFGDTPDSAELQYMKKMDVKLDTIIANQGVMDTKLTAIGLSQISYNDFAQGDINRITRYYKSLQNNIKWLGNASSAGYANQKGIYERDVQVLAGNVLGMQTTEFSPSTVRAYVKAVRDHDGVNNPVYYKKAGDLLEQLITVRFQLFAIQLASAQIDNSSSKMMGLSQTLKTDIAAYKDIADDLFKDRTVMVYNGEWGGWKGMQPSSYDPKWLVCGAQVRYEDPIGRRDDTALNGLKLKMCDSSTSWSTQQTVTSYAGRWGGWKPMVMCPTNHYVTAMQARFENN